MLYNITIIVQVLSALAIIVLVLMQHGKGADMGAAFGAGGGSSGSIFGASGSSNFLSKSTAIAAVVFFVSTLAMAYLGPYRAPAQSGVIEKLQSVTAPAPVQEAPAESTVSKEASGAAAIPGAQQTVPANPGENTSK